VRVVQADAGFSNFVRMVGHAATINGKGEGVTTEERDGSTFSNRCKCRCVGLSGFRLVSKIDKVNSSISILLCRSSGAAVKASFPYLNFSIFRENICEMRTPVGWIVALRWAPAYLISLRKARAISASTNWQWSGDQSCARVFFGPQIAS
jgi:hypothetical protein